MKPVKNIFNFECYKCEYNRKCYGGNMGNQFMYCQKSTEKLEQLEQLEQENQQLKRNCNIGNENLNFYREEYKKLEDNWNYIKEMLTEVRNEHFNIEGYCGTCTDVDIDFLLNKMQELERGVSDEQR